VVAEIPIRAVSVLGCMVRLSPSDRSDVALDRKNACQRLLDLDPHVTLDLVRYWDGLRFLFEAAHAPVNPIGDGELFPDERGAWGADGDSRTLDAGQVLVAATYLRGTPFESLAVWLPLATQDSNLYPINRDWTSRSMVDWLSHHYAGLVAFFQAAAAEGQCTVFWAA